MSQGIAIDMTNSELKRIKVDFLDSYGAWKATAVIPIENILFIKIYKDQAEVE